MDRYYYEGQLAELALYCFSVAAFLTFWLVIIDVMSKQNRMFSSFSSGFWIYKSLFFMCFFAAHFSRLSQVLGYAREESGFQNSQSNPDFFAKLGGYYFVRRSPRDVCLHLARLTFPARSFALRLWESCGPFGGSCACASVAAISRRCPISQPATVRLSLPKAFVLMCCCSRLLLDLISIPLQLSFSFFVWLSLWLGLYMMASNVYALTQLQSRYIYVSSRDYNDSSQMVCPYCRMSHA